MTPRIFATSTSRFCVIYIAEKRQGPVHPFTSHKRSTPHGITTGHRLKRFPAPGEPDSDAQRDVCKWASRAARRAVGYCKDQFSSSCIDGFKEEAAASRTVSRTYKLPHRRSSRMPELP
ncbi:hypothetical protein NUW54_g8967 [Trametes sanguinea]|uniref:Uncharacterized protein n=1 Tax=Trametes sanguinea TaxID=158606 RepID=A0ACC1PBV4_9APHY|nr:hypothetical protein NUW54_g8967 [Trametes sanguinea]